MNEKSVSACASGPPAQASFERSLLGVLFFTSGGCALLYQVVWMRNLSLVLGVTSYATSAVVAAYMGGLALGSLVGGRILDRTERPWLLFAALQLGIGVFALAFPEVLRVLRSLYVALWPSMVGRDVLFSLARATLAAAVLTVPTTLMGATFPAVVGAYVGGRHRLGRDAGWMYTVNNLGAALGSILAGFVLIEHFGVDATARIGAMVSLAGGAVSLPMALRHRARDLPRKDRAVEAHTADPALSSPRVSRSLRIALWVFAIQGFVSMALELLWTRLLVVFLGSGVYVFSAILSVFLFGMTVGSLWMTRRLAGLRDPFATLARIQVGIGLWAVGSLLAIPLLSLGRLLGFFVFGWNTGALIFGLVLCVAVVVAFPAVCIGATLPLIASLGEGRGGSLQRRLGVLGFLDSIGAVPGAPVAAFAILPALGIKGGIAMVAGLSVVLGQALWILRPDAPPGWRRIRPAVVVMFGFVGLLALAHPSIPPAVAIATRQTRLPEEVEDRPFASKAIEDAVTSAYSSRLVGTCEGKEATISVIEWRGVRRLMVDSVAASDDSLEDRPTHTMMVHVPLLLSAQPRNTLVIALGIGFTTRSARLYGSQVDVVELEGCEVRMRDAFGRDRISVFSDPGVRIVVDDARNYVLATDRKYDVIQAGIVHPAFSSGNAGFYTLDFYEDCKRVLRPGGIVSQWLPTFWMTEPDFRMLVRTFQAAFPHTSIWYKWTTDSVVLVGSEEPLQIDWPALAERARSPEIEADLAESRAEGAVALLDSFFMGEDAVRAYAGDGPLHTDERPRMEFASSRLLRHTTYDVIRGLMPFRERVDRYLSGAGADDPALHADLSRWFEGTQEVIAGQLEEERPDPAANAPMFKRAPDWPNAVRHYERALEINPADSNARFHRDLAVATVELSHALKLLRDGDLAAGNESLRRAEQARPGSRPSHTAAEIRALLPAASAPSTDAP